MSRILITGAGGMLGYDLQKALSSHELIAYTKEDLDITEYENVIKATKNIDYIINSAAYTAVDNAESDELNAYRINAQGVKNLAKAAKLHGTKLIQISTDYVFSGDATEPYPENAKHNPISAYGRTKSEGEKFALSINSNNTFIVRTAWLYGKKGNNFVKTMLNLAERMPNVSVVADQFGQPTWTKDLSQHIRLLIEKNAPVGIYHGTNSGIATWHSFAQEVYKLAGLDPKRVLETTSDKFIRPAPRPNYSVLGHEAWIKANIPEPRSWQNALKEAFIEEIFKH